MTISFQQTNDPMTGQLSDKIILYTDEQGMVWSVPMGTGHRFEELYDAWTAAGNTILPPA